MTAPPARRLLTDREVAALLGASRSYVRALVANGVLPRVELPSAAGDGRAARLLRVDQADLDALIRRTKIGGAA